MLKKWKEEDKEEKLKFRISTHPIASKSLKNLMEKYSKRYIKLMNQKNREQQQQ